MVLPKTRKAAVKTAEGTFEIKEVPMPEITQPDYVLVKVRGSGVCGSDLHSWKVPRPESVGRITGHEVAGDVVAVGEDVTNVKPSDRVGVDTVIGCGKCYWCRVGQYHICPQRSEIRGRTFAQGFSEYIVGPADHVYKIPDHVGYGEAAIMDVYGTSVHAINRTNTHMGQTVAIFGAGPIGQSLLDLVNVTGANGIIIDIIDSPLEFAENTIGALETINSTEVDPVKRVMELTDGRGADKVFDCASLSVDWRKLHWGEIDVVPVSGFYHWENDPEFKIVTDLLIKGKLHATEMITHRFPLEKINEAFETAADKKRTNSIKVIIEQ